jgi:membrane protease YdiL (CAAX protease family)
MDAGETSEKPVTIALSISIVLLATIAIFQLRTLTGRLKFTLHKNAQVDSTLKFQLAQLGLAALVLVVVYIINPTNFANFFRFGDVQAQISKIAWLGITGSETWLEIAASLGLFITLGTGIFMYFQLKKANAKFTMFMAVLPWVILFSAMNAFSEEVIFRIGVVSPLYGQLAAPTILLISGILFGLPHYFGQPSGVIGVLMAGFLGWLLAMSLVETQGLFLAWAIHFVQDVVIFVSMLMIKRIDAS